MKLTALRFQVEELTDYVYAFHDFLHAVIQLDEGRGDGFSPEQGGAFRVDSEKYLEPALHSLAKQVWENKSRTPLTLVEFARSDVVAALQVFGDEMLSSSQVIHVQASNAVRAKRLEARAQPPRIQVTNPAINVLVSDNHRLPSTAANSSVKPARPGWLAAKRSGRAARCGCLPIPTTPNGTLWRHRRGMRSTVQAR